MVGPIYDHENNCLDCGTPFMQPHETGCVFLDSNITGKEKVDG